MIWITILPGRTRSLRSANTNLLSLPRFRTTFASCGFSVAAPLCGTHSHLALATLPLPIPSVAFLKLTASSRPLAPPSGSPKCLRFGLWLTLCTLNILLTYILICDESVKRYLLSFCLYTEYPACFATGLWPSFLTFKRMICLEFNCLWFQTRQITKWMTNEETLKSK